MDWNHNWFNVNNVNNQPYYKFWKDTREGFAHNIYRTWTWGYNHTAHMYSICLFYLMLPRVLTIFWHKVLLGFFNNRLHLLEIKVKKLYEEVPYCYCICLILQLQGWSSWSLILLRYTSAFEIMKCVSWTRVTTEKKALEVTIYFWRILFDNGKCGCFWSSTFHSLLLDYIWFILAK